jgi:sugar lactone lactonase YvrE
MQRGPSRGLLAAAVFAIIVVLLSSAAYAQDSFENAEVTPATPASTLLAQWTVIDYAWPNADARFQAIGSGAYQPENNAMTGIKAFKGEIFVTIPRWRPGVPSTLNKVVNGTLVPYPSWEMQTPYVPWGLTYVQSMEIDSRGWMWILDVGRTNLLSGPSPLPAGGAPKLIIWDIVNNCSVRTFIFPDHVYSWNNSFANDIVVDETNGYAYMSDTWNMGGIVVYDFNHNIARRFDHASLNGNATNVETINGKSYVIGFPSDGIALSHDSSTVFYCDLSRTGLWSVPAALLHNFTMTSADIGAAVQFIGTKGYSDGMACTNDGRLIFGNCLESAIYSWNISTPLSTAVQLASNPETMQWPDTFGFDGQGNILWVANALQTYVFGGMDFSGASGANFRIWSTAIGANSYLSGNPQPASLPCEMP